MTRAGGEAAPERASGVQAAGPAALGPDSSRARVSPNPRAVAWSAPQLTAPWPGDTRACPWRLGACPSRAGFGLQLGASCTVSTVPAPAFPPDAWPRPAPRRTLHCCGEGAPPATILPGPGPTGRDLHVPPAQVGLLGEDPEAPQYTLSPAVTGRTRLGDSVTLEGQGRQAPERPRPGWATGILSTEPSTRGPSPTNAGTEGDRGEQGC